MNLHLREVYIRIGRPLSTGCSRFENNHMPVPISYDGERNTLKDTLIDYFEPIYQGHAYGAIRCPCPGNMAYLIENPSDLSYLRSILVHA